MIEINGKEYRNIQEQVEKNKDDIADLRTRIPYEDQFYTRVESDARYPRMAQQIDTGTASYIRRDNNGNPYIGVNSRNVNKGETYYAVDGIITVCKDEENELNLQMTPASLVATKNDVSFDLLRNNVQHDMLLSVVDDEMHAGQIHIIFYDNYNTAYEYADIVRNFRGFLYPATYGRSVHSSTLTNNIDRIYLSFYLDNDALMVEEQDDFYSGSTYTEESVHTYKIMACNDKIIKF